MGSNHNLKRLVSLLIMIVGLFTFGAANPAPMAATSASLPTPTSGWQAGFGLPGAGVGATDNKGFVYATARDATNNILYVAGDFYIAGDHNANNIALYRENTSTWDILGATSGPFGNGTDGTVYALALNSNGVLYVGGSFTRVYNDNGSSLQANNLAFYVPGTGQWGVLGLDGDTTNGVNGTVYALAANGTDIYVGGAFTEAYLGGGGTLSTRRVALWRPNMFTGDWLQLGNSTGNGVDDSVHALHWHTPSATLYVGGAFNNATNNVTTTLANGIARWTPALPSGGTWSALGSGVGAAGTVYAINSFASNLYVGGDFSEAGGNTAAKNLARWAIGSDLWTVFGIASNTGANGPVYAIGVGFQNLYIGGDFGRVYDHVNGANRSSIGIAQYNFTAQNWIPVGNASATFGQGDGALYSGSVHTLLMRGNSGSVDDLYAGGQFLQAFDSRISGHAPVNIARYQPSTSTSAQTWTTLVGSSPTEGIDPSFSLIGNTGIQDLVISGGDLYATGNFDGVGGRPAYGIAIFNGAFWRPLNTATSDTGKRGNGIGGDGRALAVSPAGNIYVAGYLSYYQPGPSNTNSIIYSDMHGIWDPVSNNWFRLTNAVGFSGVVTDIAFAPDSPNPPYLAGQFTSAPGLDPANYIVRWNGSAYERLGANINTGPNQQVSAMLWHNGLLYLGGSFTSATNGNGSTVAVNRIAVYDPATSTFSPLGNGVDASVSALITDGTYLYVGGAFDTVGADIAANRVARYHLGTGVWSALGGSGAGVEHGYVSPKTSNGFVLDLAIFDNKLYMGGVFDRIVGGATPIATANLARVDLNTFAWQAYADGPINVGGRNARVNALAFFGDILYLGGEFQFAGGVPSHRFAMLYTNTTPAPGLLAEVTGNGTVTGDLLQLNCRSNNQYCTTPFVSGTSLTLTATPDTNSTFTGWGGECAGFGNATTCTIVNPTTNLHVTATFIPTDSAFPTLTIEKIGSGSGTVATNLVGIDCGAQCSAQFTSGTQITLTATPNSGNRFISWHGGPCSGNTTSVCQFTFTTDVTITAEFDENDLIINTAGPGVGTLISDPPGINCTTTNGVQSGACSANFDIGTSVTLTVNPAIANYFAFWGQDCSGITGSICTVIMNSSKQVYAFLNLAPNLIFLPLLQR